MLDPHKRTTYVDALRPPEDYELYWAVGTTFSLDLLTLLIIPMSMAFYDCSGEADIATDQVTVLDAVRRMADRFVVFCQSGRISIPRRDTRLFNLLEQSVIEANAITEHGVFHPKTWLLRFTSRATDEVLYRFVCLSRNLTFDRSWDTILTLEGTLKSQRRVAYSRNHPLGDFLRALPSLASRSLNPSQNERIHEMSDEVRRVDFLPPSGFNGEIAFSPMGIPRYQARRRLDPMRQMLIVSPFLSNEVLEPLRSTVYRNTIVSRLDTYESLTNAAIAKLEASSDLYYVDDHVDAAELGDERVALSNENDVKGLHAKLYICEKGWDSFVSTGSANATNAAYSGSNVEFLVSLRGKKSRFGIDAFLNGRNSQGSFRKYLCRYHRTDDYTERDAEEARLEELLEQTRHRVSMAGLSVAVCPTEKNLYNVSIRSTPKEIIDIPQGVSAKCHPISLSESYAQSLAELNAAGGVAFNGLPAVSLTGFTAFYLTAQSADKTMSISFVRNLPISGLPEDRNSLVIANIINDSRSFIKYLLLLLSWDPHGVPNSLVNASHTDGRGTLSGHGPRALEETPLFEQLIRVTSRCPERVGDIDSLLDEIKKADSASAILPDGFERIWSAIKMGLRQQE